LNWHVPVNPEHLEEQAEAENAAAVRGYLDEERPKRAKQVKIRTVLITATTLAVPVFSSLIGWHIRKTWEMDLKIAKLEEKTEALREKANDSSRKQEEAEKDRARSSLELANARAVSDKIKQEHDDKIAGLQTVYGEKERASQIAYREKENELQGVKAVLKSLEETVVQLQDQLGRGKKRYTEAEMNNAYSGANRTVIPI
jgi:chromosome segregation ATPase